MQSRNLNLCYPRVTDRCIFAAKRFLIAQRLINSVELGIKSFADCNFALRAASIPVSNSCDAQLVNKKIKLYFLTA